jgi:hypothetical protein
MNGLIKATNRPVRISNTLSVRECRDAATSLGCEQVRRLNLVESELHCILGFVPSFFFSSTSYEWVKAGEQACPDSLEHVGA